MMANAPDQQKTLPIVLSFDHKFWAPAFATMRSICLTSRRRKDIVFHLCHAGLAPWQIADLEKITDEFGATLAWHDITENPRFKASLGQLKDSKRLGTSIYGRLLLDEFVDTSAPRAVYLDCDMMVKAPIERLFDIDLEANAIGAVPDAWSLLHTGGRDMREKADLFDPAMDYFNSGLLVIDLEKWRQARVWERLLNFIETGLMERLYYDQDALNIIFKDNWTALDVRWNVVNPHGAHEGLNPFILHYTGPRKPWKLVSGVAFFRIYRHVMTNTLFYKFWRFRMAQRLPRPLQAPLIFWGRRDAS